MFSIVGACNETGPILHCNSAQRRALEPRGAESAPPIPLDDDFCPLLECFPRRSISSKPAFPTWITSLKKPSDSKEEETKQFYPNQLALCAPETRGSTYLLLVRSVFYSIRVIKKSKRRKRGRIWIGIGFLARTNWCTVNNLVMSGLRASLAIKDLSVSLNARHGPL